MIRESLADSNQIQWQVLAKSLQLQLADSRLWQILYIYSSQQHHFPHSPSCALFETVKILFECDTFLCIVHIVLKKGFNHSLNLYIILLNSNDPVNNNKYKTSSWIQFS